MAGVTGDTGLGTALTNLSAVQPCGDTEQDTGKIDMRLHGRLVDLAAYELAIVDRIGGNLRPTRQEQLIDQLGCRGGLQLQHQTVGRASVFEYQPG